MEGGGEGEGKGKEGGREGEEEGKERGGGKGLFPLSEILNTPLGGVVLVVGLRGN